MEENKIREVLERYWEGETSLEEEKELKSYFASSQVTDEFAPFIPLFAFFDEEKHKEMSAHITLPNETKKAKVINFKWLINIAASIVIFIAMFFINKNLNRESVQQYAYHDTYQTPEEAYLEVKQALLFVSAKMNKGVSTVSHSLGKMEPLDKIIN
ncbi:MAG: hypothetical protein IPL46_32760 [Saprospiraceae bacterium]|nr:hypothetical protein [Saprospiraceae bacterium]